MRSILIRAISALALVLVTIAVWNRRYVTDTTLPLVTLEDLSASLPGLRGVHGDLAIEQPDPGKPVAWLIPLPAFESATRVQIELGLKAEDLHVGAESWQDGKVSLEGVDAGGRRSQIYIGSVQGSGQFQASPRIARPPECTGGLFLRLEHLGVSGSYRLTDFEMIGVRKTFSGRITFAATGLAWLIWIAWMAGPLRERKTWCAAALWIFIAAKIILPGPWALEGPLGNKFAQLTSSSTPTFEVAKGERVEVIGKLPETGGYLLRAKLHLRPIRPLLHGLLFLIPTLIFAALLTMRAAIILSSLLVIGVEGAQWAFGFGFDWTDVMDLLWDAMGIGLAVATYPKIAALLGKLPVRLKSPDDQADPTIRP